MEKWDKYKKKKDNIKEENTINKTSINWYPGHMAKTKRLISENIKLIDIVYEVIDGRIPISSKIKDIDDLIKDKPRILVVTKTDLCDNVKTDELLKIYESKGYKVVKVDLMKNINVDEIIKITNDLLKFIDESRIKKGLKKRAYRALIVGIPNVGKSTLINRLVGKKSTMVGNKPGVTKNLSWIRINKDIELLDSPGILWPKFDNEEVALNLASFSAINENILNDRDIAIYILNKLDELYKDKLKDRYNIDSVNKDDYLSTFKEIGIRFGCLLKGNEINYEKVYKIIIDDIKNEVIKGITFDK